MILKKQKGKKKTGNQTQVQWDYPQSNKAFPISFLSNFQTAAVPQKDSLKTALVSYVERSPQDELLAALH